MADLERELISYRTTTVSPLQFVAMQAQLTTLLTRVDKQLSRSRSRSRSHSMSRNHDSVARVARGSVLPPPQVTRDAASEIVRTSTPMPVSTPSPASTSPPPGDPT